MRLLFVSVLLLFLAVTTKAQFPGIRVVQFDEIEKIMNSKSDTTTVLNFWATWCKPCVEELPYFEKITRDYKGQKLKVILVCMDFKSKLKERVVPFVKKNGIVSEVYLLNEPDYNAWIDKVNPKWSGSIPATLIVKGSSSSKEFYEQPFEYDQLKTEIEKVINK